MPAPITAIGTAGNVAPLLSPAQNGPPGEFRNVLASAIQKVETSRLGAEQSVERFLAGEGEELHQSVLATQRAELAFEMFLQVRNKVVQAYQEVMRMQM